MKTLVINCGSSSIKYQLLDMSNEAVLAEGIADAIGLESSCLKHKYQGGSEKVVLNVPMENHQKAIELVMNALTNDEYGVIKDMSEIEAVGHRVVHGGEKFKSSVLITDEVTEAIKDCSDLAPLHNPANLVGINACKELMPNVPMVAVFDTAFHQTMPQKAYLYGIPYAYYKEYGVRRYGFHGTSHRYVSARTAELLGKPVEDLKIVVCHLGNGASCCAIDGGKSVDTSMGLTPLEGLIMGTRSGDLDPAIIQFIMDKEGLTIDEMMNVLNKKSGILGVSEISSDFRAIEDGVAEGDKDAQRANDVCNYRIAKYIGAYAAAMNGLDAVVFTAGLGENNPLVRKEVCEYLQFLGLEIDEEANKFRSKERIFSTENSRVAAMCVPTNEEVMIARDTKEIVK